MLIKKTKGWRKDKSYPAQSNQPHAPHSPPLANSTCISPGFLIDLQ
jgi:hypothetical protein